LVFVCVAGNKCRKNYPDLKVTNKRQIRLPGVADGKSSCAEFYSTVFKGEI
jgi:hypothetical protein